MLTEKKPKKVKCTNCGGKGFVFENTNNGNDTTCNKTRKLEEHEELRIPNLTGTKEQCDEAMYIRARFVQVAKKQYNDELFNTFIKLISYESHAAFWIYNKKSNIGRLIAHISSKNPSAFELIDRMIT